MIQLEKEKSRTNYHREWRKKNPKKYAMNQLTYWKRQVEKLEQKTDEEEKELVNV